MVNIKEEFVQRQYFIDRIFALETKYKNRWEGWDEFLQSYESGDSAIDANNFELDEWAFLCKEFKSDVLLVELDRQHDPPAQWKKQKPESDSGFCFARC